ncbi:hypothetical protein MSG28_014555 [Choristoneura fumiferana]|uniref:Uncharacterized protein n=1 Tax=Choristoneura fumiferana TaxID=7141 RepID=A0ACC0JRU0_CHOFU|nr:hypothetical protein MSG28_014555 [Choristoneura fumiferana]
MMSDVEEPPTKVIKMDISQDQKLTDDTMNSTQMEPEPQPAAPELKMQESIKMEQNIEDTLNNFEKSESEKNEKNDAFDQLLKKEKGSDLEQSEKHSDDDGHNTDDLLPQEKKKEPEEIINEEEFLDDDDFDLDDVSDKAHKLLTEEKHRVTAQLAALRQSVTALRSTERVQKDQIKVATEALHELDTMLAAA